MIAPKLPKVPHYVRYIEHDEQTGRTWNYWILLEGNEGELELLGSYLLDMTEQGKIDIQFVLTNEQRTEAEVDIMVRNTGESEFPSHTKMKGHLLLPPDFGELNVPGDWPVTALYILLRGRGILRFFEPDESQSPG